MSRFHPEREPRRRQKQRCSAADRVSTRATNYKETCGMEGWVELYLVYMSQALGQQGPSFFRGLPTPIFPTKRLSRRKVARANFSDEHALRNLRLAQGESSTSSF